jgi:hypothetical protein
MKRTMRLAAMLALALAAACSNDSQELPPDAGVVRAVHAIPELATLTMNLDSSPLGDFDYLGIRGINRPGDGNHELSFDVKLPGGQPATRLETLTVATGVDLASTIVLTGPAGQPDVLTWEQPARNWEAEQADSGNAIDVLEISFGHAALSRGPLDFYVGASPVDPTTSTPVATLGYEDVSAFVEIDAATLEIVVTPAGDPATELYDSDPLALPAATSLLFVALDGAKMDGDSPWLEMRSLGEAFSNAMPNRNIPPNARAMHVSQGVGSLDLIRHSNGDVLIAGIAFGEISPYVVAPTGTNTIDVTPAGDPAEVLAAITLIAGAGTDSTILVVGDAEDVSSNTLADDVRRVATMAKFRVINTSTSFETIDAYVLEPGTSVEDRNPTFAAVTTPFGSGYVGFEAGDYDLVLTQSTTKDIVAGPTRVTFRNSGIYGVVALEAGQNDVEQLFIDDDPTE